MKCIVFILLFFIFYLLLFEYLILWYYFRHNISLDSIVDHAESNEDVINRQKQFIESLVTDIENNVNETEISDFYPVLVVTHGRFIKIFLQYFCSLESNSIENCSITTLDLIITSHDSNVDHSSNIRSIHEWYYNNKIYKLIEVIPHEINNTNHLKTF